MSQRSGGVKRSSWQAFRRRLLLIRLLLRAPCTNAELIAGVRSELGDEAYPTSADSALKHDLDGLKREFGCIIRFRRKTNSYVLESLGELALCDLPDRSIETIGLLDASFGSDTGFPEYLGIDELLERIIMLLPEQRQQQLRRMNRIVQIRTATLAQDNVDTENIDRLKRAIDARQEVDFRYHGLHDLHGPRRHRVAPYGILLRPEGHGYLDATFLESQPPGREIPFSTIHYRLDRIVAGSVMILPTALPPQRPQPKRYTLRYTLLAQVARRRDITLYFPDSSVVYHNDGSATVTAQITNLWQARQILLRYGSACTVREPSELIALFQDAVRGLAALYGNDGAGEPRSH